MVFILSMLIASVVTASQAFAGKIARSGQEQPILRTLSPTAAQPVVISIEQPFLRTLLLPIGQVIVVPTSTGGAIVVGGGDRGPDMMSRPRDWRKDETKDDGGWGETWK